MKYRLKKDSPAFKSGYVFTYDPEESYDYLRDSDGTGIYRKSQILDFDEWFEEVQEPKWTDADMVKFAIFSEWSNLKADKALEEWKLRSEQTVHECDATNSK